MAILLKHLQLTQQRPTLQVPELLPGKNPIVDFGAMLGGAGHVSCPACGSPWFHVHVDGCAVNLGCAGGQCMFNVKAIMPNGFDQQGDIRCANPKCPSDKRQMAVAFSGRVVSCGCRRCEWELRADLVSRSQIIGGR